jgi:hypothetical protein
MPSGPNLALLGTLARSSMPEEELEREEHEEEGVHEEGEGLAGLQTRYWSLLETFKEQKRTSPSYQTFEETYYERYSNHIEKQILKKEVADVIRYFEEDNTRLKDGLIAKENELKAKLEENLYKREERDRLAQQLLDKNR